MSIWQFKNLHLSTKKKHRKSSKKKFLFCFFTNSNHKLTFSCSGHWGKTVAWASHCCICTCWVVFFFPDVQVKSSTVQCKAKTAHYLTVQCGTQGDTKRSFADAQNSQAELSPVTKPNNNTVHWYSWAIQINIYVYIERVYVCRSNTWTAVDMSPKWLNILFQRKA